MDDDDPAGRLGLLMGLSWRAVRLHRWLRDALLLSVGGLCALTSSAQVARTEIHPFQSVTLSDKAFLTGEDAGPPVTLAGELRLPRNTGERLPVVVLLHGSGGVSGYVTDWEQEFNAMGVATFVIDSFTARGIVNVNNDQSQLGRLAMIIDVYRALALLARHPRIDPQRIVLMGFSRGGQAVLYASLKRFQQMHARGEPGYAAYIAFYPSCNTSFHEDDAVVDKPIRIFHGNADDYVPVGPCRDYVARLKARGADVQLAEYEGAGHVFDWKALSTPVKLDKAQTTRHCTLAESQAGEIVNTATGKPFSYSDPCVEHGATMAYNAHASEEARRAVKSFLSTLLKP